MAVGGVGRGWGWIWLDDRAHLLGTMIIHEHHLRGSLFRVCTTTHKITMKNLASIVCSTVAPLLDQLILCTSCQVDIIISDINIILEFLFLIFNIFIGTKDDLGNVENRENLTWYSFDNER